MIRVLSRTITAWILLTPVAFAADKQPPVSSPVRTLSWQQPTSRTRLVAADEFDIVSPTILEPQLTLPSTGGQNPNQLFQPPVPDAPIQPEPELAPPPSAGQPNSNLPPDDEDDPDYSEVRNFEASQPQPHPETSDSEIGEPIPVADSFADGSISNGFWFDHADGCGESCRPSLNHSCFRNLSDEACSVFTVYTGVAFLHRNASKNQRLIVNPANPLQNLDAGDFKFGMESGIEVGATAHHLFGDVDLDVRYISVGEFSDQERRRVTGTATRLNMGFPINLPGARSVVADYSSDFSSFEAGLRYRMGAANDWTSFWIGLRSLNIGEQLTSTLTSPGGLQQTQILSTNVTNRLFGLQVGMDQTLLGDQQHSLEAYWRAGIYGNDSDAETRLIGVSTPPTINAARGGSGRTAFVGEIGLKGKLRLTSNLNLYSRYQMLFAEGIALAGEQSAASSLITQTGHTTNGSLFYQGASLGLEYVY